MSTLNIPFTSSVSETSTSPVIVKVLEVATLPTLRSPSIVPPVSNKLLEAEPIRVAVISLAAKSPLLSSTTTELAAPVLENDRLPAL